MKLNPNQYIYRRRIEQYGARLGKPYPFYDWVEQATTEIRERGDEPVELKVSISGAEIASPSREFATATANQAKMDWDTAIEIEVDDADLVSALAVAVPAKVTAGKATRVHVLVSPSENSKWNNEAGPATFVLNSVSNAQLSTSSFEHPLPKEVESNETRRFEFEVLVDPDASGSVIIEGAVLINVCVSDSGLCNYLRKPFQIEIEVN